MSIGMSLRTESNLDITVRFGQQVRYQCRAKTGCRRYFKVENGRGTCGHCGTHYSHQDPDTGLFTSSWIPAREAVPA